MFYVTGDCHGDWVRFDKKNFPEQKDMDRTDYVLILGDFGLWDNSRKENMMLDWLNSKSYTTLFVDGNHENYDLLDSYPTEEWNGGIVQKLRPNIIHLMRGQIYTLDNKKIFTFGGASSHDISDGILEPTDPDFEARKRKLDQRGKWMYRINHLSWWERELPSADELDAGISNLENHGWKVDYIFSHCAPTSVLTLMDKEKQNYRPDYFTDYLEDIASRCDYRVWLFGHMHTNERITDRHICLYKQIIRIW